MKRCENCNEPNPEGWFYCRECGGKTSKPSFTTNMYIITKINNTQNNMTHVE